jgi:hypothetical protein
MGSNSAPIGAKEFGGRTVAAARSPVAWLPVRDCLPPRVPGLPPRLLAAGAGEGATGEGGAGTRCHSGGRGADAGCRAGLGPVC